MGPKKPDEAAVASADTDDNDEGEDLSAAQLEQLGADVDAAIAALEVALAENGEDAAPVDLEAPIGRLSRMDAMQQQQLASARQRLQQQRLTALTAAKARLADGRYGFCRRCSDPIAFRRLRVQPEALLCLSCQRSVSGG